METFIDILTPLRVYLRLWDKDKVDITAIFRETLVLQSKMEAVFGKLCSSGAIRRTAKTSILRALDARINGPLTLKVRVILLTDIHYLAASVSPDTDPDCFADIMPRALRAFNKFLVNAPGIFSEEKLASITPEEMANDFQKELMMFTGGAAPPILVGCAVVKNGCDCLGGFWVVWQEGCDTQARWSVEILPFGVICPAERSFSAEKNTHTLKRNRLGSERVRMLTFCRWNLRLFDGMSPKLRGAIEDVVNLIEEELDENEDEDE
eukprot:Plantae.Rhodophyta-Palmaria_palmata.ctg18085.p1 GENE.Plantae.Rhodophyta-Palmaria_palmata.ctg18085~~Plantae.Rhodophyta-Palmaria_palmata.ctg18085.p1  ORF type:complete len:265 (-),score=47.86 Plantae.Rhodophyta-Palmaria_palmata.ctg18085:161-955(-)